MRVKILIALCLSACIIGLTPISTQAGGGKGGQSGGGNGGQSGGGKGGQSGGDGGGQSEGCTSGESTEDDGGDSDDSKGGGSGEGKKKGKKFKAADTNGDGALSLEEFKVMHAARQAKMKERLGDQYDEAAAGTPTAEEAFAEIDADASGSITKYEMAKSGKKGKKGKKGDDGKNGDDEDSSEESEGTETPAD